MPAEDADDADDPDADDAQEAAMEDAELDACELFILLSESRVTFFSGFSERYRMLSVVA